VEACGVWELPAWLSGSPSRPKSTEKQLPSVHYRVTPNMSAKIANANGLTPPIFDDDMESSTQKKKEKNVKNTDQFIDEAAFLRDLDLGLEKYK